MTNRITATAMIARPASSPAPMARRSAASGLDRSARPSKLVSHATAGILFSMLGNQIHLSQRSLTQSS
jgi:hypothetical protein